MSATKSPYFCVLPWYSKELNGTLSTPCCLLAKTYSLDSVKKDLLDGVQTRACKECWNIEARGEDSRRLQENRFLDYKLDRDIELIEQDCRDGKNQTLMYQIMLSNLCNQACVTCDPRYSTKWAGLLTGADKKTINIRQSSLADVDINYPDAKRIYILGGEPLFDPRAIEILEKLIQHNNTDCFISFVTNGSVHLTKHMEDVLSQFTDLNICISIDGIESRFEYMRWPGRWHTLLENIDQYRQAARNNISVSYTISAVNAIYYDETVNWFDSRGLRYNHNVIVQGPNWASLPNAPREIKAQLGNSEFFRPWAKINGNETPLSTLAQELEKQDQMKKINLKNYMPELWAILSNAS